MITARLQHGEQLERGDRDEQETAPHIPKAAEQDHAN